MVDTFERTDPTADYKREISKQKFWKAIYGMHIEVKPEPVPQSKDFDEHTEEEENSYVQQLRDIQNEHGGGMSKDVSGKYTSVRHELAKAEGKYTAGEAAKILSKKLERKLSAKEIVEAYKLIYGREPEWHHAGFYKNSKGKSTMGRTFFFDDSDLKEMEADWGKVAEERAKLEAETKRKEETKVQGFYYDWESDYSGPGGKKKNFKVLRTYSGSELNLPKNFTKCSEEEYNCAKLFDGKNYYGWDEPVKSEFTKEAYEAKLIAIKQTEEADAERMKAAEEADKKRYEALPVAVQKHLANLGYQSLPSHKIFTKRVIKELLSTPEGYFYWDKRGFPFDAVKGLDGKEVEKDALYTGMKTQFKALLKLEHNSNKHGYYYIDKVTENAGALMDEINIRKQKLLDAPSIAND